MPEPSRFASSPRVSTQNRETANDRFKRRFGATFWSSLIAAVSLHFLLFAFFPTMSVADTRPDEKPIIVLELPPELVLPPPPERLERPALPVASPVVIDEDPLPRTVIPLDRLPPLALPPIRREREESGRGFVPVTVRPQLRNGAEIERLLQRRYPPILRDAGIKGVVRVSVHIDEEGSVLDGRIEEPSEHDAFNSVALDVIHAMKFTPALNRDRRVSVWVSIPIRFESR